MAVTPKRDVAACAFAICDLRFAILKSEPRYLGCHGFARRMAQTKIVAAQDDRVPARFAQFINHDGQPRSGVLSLRADFQRELTVEAAVIDVRQLERHEPQAHAALPGLPQHLVQSAKYV